MNKLKLGSLFDGIGGFPLSAQRHGIEPVWASEIEPFPIKVTQHHFPNMKHLGDITQINGAEIEPVDIITFGSPCQDLSVAGKREGLEGERSGLFMDAVRIIREMRTATRGQCPRFAVWENVPGAFSSNKGEDFRAVLSEIAETEIPMPRSGKWANAGMVRTERIDIAWRTLDAQYWGVPQRRKRIFLVADFTGQCAGEILFKPEGLRGHSAESREAREGIAEGAGNGAKVTSGVKSYLFENHSQDTRYKGPLKVAQPVTATYGMGGNNQPFVVHKDGGGDRTAAAEPGVHQQTYVIQNATRGEAQNGLGVSTDDVSYTLDCLCNHAICLQGSMIGRADKNGPQGDGINEDVSFTLNTTDRHAVAYNAVATMDCRNLCENEELSGTIQAKENGGYSLNYQNPVRVGYAVRRLTPLECERLMGFPDGWTDIPGASDTARYKALGNSIAIPCLDYIFQSMSEVIKEGRA